MNELATSWVVHLVVGGSQAAAVGLLALAAVRLAPRTSAAWRHAVLAIALLKFALPPMIPLPFGAFSALTARLRPTFDGVESSVETAGFALALVALHLAGMAVAATRLALGGWRWRRLVRAATGEERLGAVLRECARAAGWRCVLPDVRVADSLAAPMAGGLLRPAVLLPAELARTASPERLRLVLRHELEHLARRDPWWNLLGALLGVLWWWHPVLRLVVREARSVREERCDDAVVTEAPDALVEYAHALIDLAPRASGLAVPSPACAASAEPLERRLRRLLDGAASRRARVSARARVALVLLALGALPGLGFARFHLGAPAPATAGDALDHRHSHAHTHDHPGPAARR